MSGIRILGAGCARGDTEMTNETLSLEIAEALEEKGEPSSDFSDPVSGSRWIREKSGIERRWYAWEKTNADMAAEAAENAIRDAGVRKEDIGILIVCTFTPDAAAPSTASTVAGQLGLGEDLLAFDLNGACSGFLYGLAAADAFLADAPDREAPLTDGSDRKSPPPEAGGTKCAPGKLALVIGSEKLSPYLDPSDPATAILFGDGAGAVVLRHDETKPFRFRAGSCPDEEMLSCPRDGRGVRMKGQEVYRFAVGSVPEAVRTLLEKIGLRPEDADRFVLHQSNERILDRTSRRLDLPEDKMFKNIRTWGNTSSASLAIALSEMKESGLLGEGERIVLCGYGAGMTYGAAVITG
ncbi:MAG: 3-oxoacyl-ACP synthase III family protein [Anaerovoracaceae bacterium]|jgi:3-oxoacyl-[acyl-carrier-protein] synthase-3